MTNLMRHLRTWTPPDYLTAIESVAWAVMIEVGLRVLSMATIFALMERVPRLTTATLLADGWAPISRFAAVPYRIVAAQGTCLRRSPVLCAMLRLRGSPAHVCIGVARRDGALAAHAWVAVPGSTPPAEFLQLTRAWSA